MNSQWQDVGCASIPARDLPILADLRRRPGIRVSIVGDRAWVTWASELESARQLLLERLVPLSGVELFARRNGRWYRPGEHLPAFGVPIGEGTAGAPLERVVLPRPMSAASPADISPNPIPLRLVRDPRCQPRPAVAVTCPLARLAEWAERETTARIAALTAAWLSNPDGEPGDAEVLVLGPSGILPPAPGGARFWGADLLIPIGFRVAPDLSEPALRRIVGAGPDDLVVLDAQGPELIPREVFRPLSRAAIRLTRAGRAPGRWEGNRRP
jgi:MoxR-vWA-beta-propeller ternary system domain bpX2